MANEINLQQSDFGNPQKLKVLMKLNTWKPALLDSGASKDYLWKSVA